MEDATQSAPLEPSVIKLEATGFAILATRPARLASTNLHTAPAVSMVWDTFSLLPYNSHVCCHVLMVLIFKMGFARSATSAVPPALDQQLTAFHALPIKSSTQEDVGLPVPPSATLSMDSMPPAVTAAPMAITRYPILSVHLAHLSALPAVSDLVIVLLASKDQSQSTEPAQSLVDKTSSVSVEFALPALLVATDASTLLRTA
jgi:hypothetical protein